MPSEPQCVRCKTTEGAKYYVIADDLHIGDATSDTTDRLFKGLKNTIRDRFKEQTGTDPAPSYPVKATLPSKTLNHSTDEQPND